MKRIVKSAFSAAVLIAVASCASQKQYEMGMYGNDLSFFKGQGIETLELTGDEGKSRIMIIPRYQGRVMTSTADGLGGMSFGWINHAFIRSGETSPQFNPVGGEERFWIGPEGGPYSWYFQKGKEQVYANWKVPSVIDTDPWETVEEDNGSVVFEKSFRLENASGNTFDIGVRRSVELLNRTDAAGILGTPVPEGVKCVAYRTVNGLTNDGDYEWTKETGMPSVWLLGMFNPTPTTVVFIPYNEDYDGRKVNDEYFGKIPSDRLVADNGILYFKIDGKFRSKLGLPEGSARDVCGSYDYAKGVLTIIKYTLPEDGNAVYVNGQWGPQEDPYSGDVINAYNDGPTEDGTVMGPFYEMETSSPAAALKPGETLSHIQTTMHFSGAEDDLDILAREIFGTSLKSLSGIFNL